FARKFQVMTYRCSHSELLLRSGKTADTPTRVDVLFKDVRALELRIYLSELFIEEIDPSQLGPHSTKPIEAVEQGHRAYLIKSGDWSGHIIAGAVFWHEDDGEFGAPSSFMPEVALLG